LEVLAYDRSTDAFKLISPNDILKPDSLYKLYSFVNSSQRAYPYAGSINEELDDPNRFPMDEAFEFLNAKRSTEGSVVPITAVYNVLSNKVEAIYSIRMAKLVQERTPCSDIGCRTALAFGFIFMPKDAKPEEWRKARRFAPGTAWFDVGIEP
jgi:hypothetical protein